MILGLRQLEDKMTAEVRELRGLGYGRTDHVDTGATQALGQESRWRRELPQAAML